jgi:hypothetical protein
MTGPMTFLPSPKPTLPDQCDGVDAFGDVAAVAADNYTRFNSYLANSPNAAFVHAYQDQIAGWEYQQVSGSTGGWVNIPNPNPFTGLGLLSPFSFTLPNPCGGVLCILNASVVALGTTLGVSVGYTLSGPGIPTTVGPYATGVGVKNQMLLCHRVYLVSASELVAGQLVTVTPQWRLENAYAPLCFIGASGIHLYAFKGTL